MEFLGLHYAIWIVLALYFAGMLLLGWWSKRGIHDREGFLLGKRQFGVSMMVMHAFGAGTHPGDVAGVTSKTVQRGASGIWSSWMWMFGTPFYWLIAPIVRRMRCLTLADFFEERYGRAAAALYVVVAMIGMTIAGASILLATTRTVQGMMGPKAGSDAWFFGILLISTAVFMVYSYWGGIVAAIRTDMIQGLMIIALSFIAIPAAMNLPEVGGLSGAKKTIAAARARFESAKLAPAATSAAPTTASIAPGPSPDTATTEATLSLFDPKYFSLWAVLILCINAPFSMMAQPHLMSVSAAGRTEWEGRVGFTYGNILKRICTMGWCILGLCWLAYLLQTSRAIPHVDAAFGDSVRELLHPLLQGLMLACVMAAAMSSGDALQVTIGGLFSQNVYRPYIRPHADEEHYVRVTRYAGLVVIAAAVVFAILMRASGVVETILDYFKITAAAGVSVVLGILWRRMNSGGVYVSTLAAGVVFIVTRYVLKLPQAATTGLPLAAGILGGIVGSLVTRPPKREVIEEFFGKIYTPIGQEDKLGLPLDQAVPPEKRLLTCGGLFIVKPSRQSWVGFLLTLAICLACVGAMWALLM